MKLKITKEERQGLKKVFENFGREKNEAEIFYDLCFCILAPQITFKNNRKVIEQLWKEDFYNMPYRIFETCKYCKQALEETLKPTRFYKNKMKYLIEAKKKFPAILGWVKNWKYQKKLYKDYEECRLNNYYLRDLLVKHIKGLGMKTASHFLRNLGDTELVIIDTHILKFFNAVLLNSIKELGVELRTPTSKKFYEILEILFQRTAKENKLTTAQLDALVWKRYSGTEWNEFKW